MRAVCIRKPNWKCVVVALAATAALASGAASAAADVAFTSPGGVTYFGASGAASFNFTNPPPAGTMEAGVALAGNSYQATITCATFLGNGVAYFGAHMTSSIASTAQGMYEYWRVTAGGPGVGTVAGLEYPTETCYDGANADPGWNIFTIETGSITVETTPIPPATAFVLPPSTQCVSKRRFTIHVRQWRGLTWEKVVVALNGKQIKTIGRSNQTALVNLVGLPKGTFALKITATATNGETATGTRVYHTCVPKSKSHYPTPRL
jgi:hypothetical protein